MDKKPITGEALKALVEKRATADPDCREVRDVRIFAGEEPGDWTIAFAGILGDEVAQAALWAIVAQLQTEYALARVTH